MSAEEDRVDCESRLLCNSTISLPTSLLPCLGCSTISVAQFHFQHIYHPSQDNDGTQCNAYGSLCRWQMATCAMQMATCAEMVTCAMPACADGNLCNADGSLCSADGSLNRWFELADNSERCECPTSFSCPPTLQWAGRWGALISLLYYMSRIIASLYFCVNSVGCRWCKTRRRFLYLVKWCHSLWATNGTVHNWKRDEPRFRVPAKVSLQCLGMWDVGRKPTNWT